MRHLLLVVSSLFIASTAFADTTPQPLPFSQDWTNTGLITTDDDWAGVPGVIGYRGDGLTTATNVNPQTVVAESTVVDVNTSETNPNTFSTGGVTEFEIADPSIALSGSGTADAPYVMFTVDTSGAGAVRVSYNLRDLDGSVDNSVQQVALQYRVGTTGDFTDVPAGYVADASTGPSLATLVTPISVVLPAAAANQPVVQIRVITTDAVGNDEWIGVDDISITNATTNPSAAGMSSPASALRNASVTLTAAVTPGTFPDSTNLAVTCDLSSMAGSATATLVDDGTNGDGMGGDNVFTFATTVPMASTAGAKTFPCTVSDAESRTGTFNITFTVNSVCGDGIVEGAETCDDQGTNAGDGCSDTCTLEAGWDCMGQPTVCIDIDECAQQTDNCDANASCTNMMGSFSCTCNTGFEGNGATCTDIDECATNMDNCDTNATCTNNTGSFSCACNTGYSGNGVTCTDIDECTANSDDCDALATCANTMGTFTCTCPTGYTGTGHGANGCTDVDECTAGTDTCDTNAACTNTAGAFTCACNAGFTGDGMTCTDVDECANGGDNCDANATCTNTPGSFTCACAAGYSGDGTSCMPNCGDGTMLAPEACDDGNMTDGDGCTKNCAVEDGYACTGSPSSCRATCGDGLTVGIEQCDDANTDPDDGCAANCTVEDGWTCTGEPSTCDAPDDGGCCSSSTHPGGVALLVLFVIGGLHRRRRRA